MSQRIGGPARPQIAPTIATPTTAPIGQPLPDNRPLLTPTGGFDASREVLARHTSIAHITAALSRRVNVDPTTTTPTTPTPTTPTPGTDPTTPPPPLPPPPPPLESKRSAIKRAELALRRAGFDTGKVDGIISPRTRKALAAFQRSVGLDPSGQLDRKSYNHLQTVQRRVRKHGGQVMGPGQKSSRVRKVQIDLRKLGYDVGKVDGVYDTKVADATKAFRRDQKNLKGRSGLIGPHSNKILRNESKRMNHNPYRRRVKASQKRKVLDQRAAKAAARPHRDGTQGFGVGSKGPSIAYAQQHLRAAGYDPKNTKGHFDERTEGAVKLFQRHAKIPVTGRIDAKTWRHLKNATIESNGAFSPAQREGEFSNAVKRSEQLLKKLGFNPGKVEGLYSSQTQKAVDAFRKKHKLKGRGKGITKSTYNAMQRVYKRQQNPFGKAINTTGYVNGVPRNIKVVEVESGKRLELSTAKAYHKMKQAAAKDGVYLHLNSGFRTMAEQQYLYNGYISGKPGFNLAARPGYSNHQSGVALDLNTQGVSTSTGTGTVYNWLAKNAHKFGFKRIPAEHWHWEYQPGLAKYR